MKKRYKKEYSTRTSATLRRNLQFARDPQHNGVVAVLQERYAKLIRDAFIAKGNPTTSISAETINEMAIEMAVKALQPEIMVADGCKSQC